MKKVISLILSVMMIASLFAGCAASNSTATTAPKETAAPETEAPAAAEYTVAIVQQLDHAALDEIRTAAIAELQAKAAGNERW